VYLFDAMAVKNQYTCVGKRKHDPGRIVVRVPRAMSEVNSELGRLTKHASHEGPPRPVLAWRLNGAFSLGACLAPIMIGRDDRP
jgi:hypothetical protein